MGIGAKSSGTDSDECENRSSNAYCIGRCEIYTRWSTQLLGTTNGTNVHRFVGYSHGTRRYADASNVYGRLKSLSDKLHLNFPKFLSLLLVLTGQNTSDSIMDARGASAITGQKRSGSLIPGIYYAQLLLNSFLFCSPIPSMKAKKSSILIPSFLLFLSLNSWPFLRERPEPAYLFLNLSHSSSVWLKT